MPPKSKDFEKDLDRRVRVIEGALGIDMTSSSVCSGNPEDCPSDPCVPERCPMHNSVVRRTADKIEALVDGVDTLLLALEEIGVRKESLAGVVPLARLRLSLRKALRRREDLAEMGKVSPGALIADMIAEADRNTAELEKKIKELRKAC